MTPIAAIQLPTAHKANHNQPTGNRAPAERDKRAAARSRQCPQQKRPRAIGIRRTGVQLTDTQAAVDRRGGLGKTNKKSGDQLGKPRDSHLGPRAANRNSNRQR